MAVDLVRFSLEDGVEGSELLKLLEDAGAGEISAYREPHQYVASVGGTQHAIVTAMPPIHEKQSAQEPFGGRVTFVEVWGETATVEGLGDAIVDGTEAGFQHFDQASDAVWSGRDRTVSHGDTAVVEMPVSRLEATPWVYFTLAARGLHRGTPVLRTPASTQVSPGMRRILREGTAVWVREEAGGPVEGLTGRPWEWATMRQLRDAQPTGRADDDLATLRVQVVHAAADGGRVGALAERVMAQRGMLLQTFMGRHEPAHSEWQVRHILKAVHRDGGWIPFYLDSEGFAGRVAFTVGETGIVEDFDVEIGTGLDVAAVWDEIADLRPVYFYHREADASPSLLVHRSAAAHLGTQGRDLGGGYLAPSTEQTSELSPIARHLLERNSGGE